MKRGFRGGLVALATLGLLLAVAAAMCSAQTREDCIQATCKVRADDGSTGTGTLYAYGEHRGRRVGLVVTVAHVTTTQYATCWFGRAKLKTRGVVIWKRRDIDAAVIAVDGRWFGRRLQPVPLFQPRGRFQKGQAIFSIGHPAGGPALLWRGVLRGYNSNGSLVFWPGPELGRSGSALFLYDAAGKAAIIGVISTRNSGNLTSATTGQATSIDYLKSRELKTRVNIGLFPVAVTAPGACGPYGCPSDSTRRYKSPYRYKMDERVQRIEKSQGTLPLPPPPQQLPPPQLPPPQLLPPPQQQCPPPVDLTPLMARLDAVSNELAAVKDELATVKGEMVVLTARADNVKATAEAMAEKYEKDFPGLAEDLRKTIEAPLKQVKDVAEAAAKEAELAALDAAVAKTEADVATTKAEDAQTEVTEAKGLLARIEKAKADGAEGVREVARAVVWDIVKSYGWQVGGIFGIGVFLLYRRIKTGESVVRRVRKRVTTLRQKVGEVVDPDEDEDEDEEDATA